MNKLELRQRQKAIAAASVSLGFIKRANELPDTFFKTFAYEALRVTALVEVQQITKTPTQLFRTDKPKLDPRRVRRAERKRPKGQIVSINVGRGVDIDALIISLNDAIQTGGSVEVSE